MAHSFISATATGLHGWQFWPLVGNEHKDVTTQTNGFGDIKTIGGHDNFFALWPLFFNNRSGIGTTNEQRQQASLPAFSLLRSPMRDSTTVIWPFFNYVDDREKKYREWDAPWPLIVFARGEGKTTARVWPFFSQAHNADAGERFLSLADLQVQPACTPPRSTAGAPAFASSSTPT